MLIRYANPAGVKNMAMLDRLIFKLPLGSTA
jgi:hypothetical protein